MRTATLIIMLVVLTTQMATAWASGCKWYDKYELGKNQGVTDTTGMFTCQEVIRVWSNCRFTSTDGQTRLLSEQAIADDLIPPLDQLLPVSVSSYEAMHWQSCDGGDPTPPCVKNGIYDFLTYGGRKYSQFIDLEKSLQNGK